MCPTTMGKIVINVRAKVPCTYVVGKPPDVIQMGVGNEDMPLVTAPLGAAPRVKNEVELWQYNARFLH